MPAQRNRITSPLFPDVYKRQVIVHTVAIARIVHTAATVRTALIVHTIRVDKELGKIRMGVDFSAPIFDISKIIHYLCNHKSYHIGA